MNRAHIEMKLIFTWALMNVKLSSCSRDADGQAPNTIMAYIEANRTNAIVYIGISEATSRIPRSVTSASPGSANADLGPGICICVSVSTGSERMAGRYLGTLGVVTSITINTYQARFGQKRNSQKVRTMKFFHYCLMII